jgi:nucleotide-binding universal stress UspA family protein
MYKKMMVPVDLAHANSLEKALTTAADLSKHYGTPIVYVGVTATTPGPVAHTPEEFAQKLDAFAKGQAEKHGVDASAKAITVPDPTVDLHHELIDAMKEVGADLVVMASHVPGTSDYVFASYGGHFASHADASVFLIR